MCAFLSVFPLDRGAGSNKEANKSYLRMVFLFTLVAPVFGKWFGVNNFKSIQFRPNNQVLFACLIIEGEGGGRGGKGVKLQNCIFWKF